LTEITTSSTSNLAFEESLAYMMTQASVKLRKSL